MGKRPRTPHFISGIGDGNVNMADGNKGRLPNDDFFGGGTGGGGSASNNNNNHNNHNNNNNNNGLPERYVRTRNERLARLEEPLLSTTEHWREVFGSGDPAGIGKPPTIADHWQASAFAILGMIVVISAIFLHFVSDHPSEPNTPYHYRRRQRQRRREYKKKKKTDEWSDDEEEVILQNSMKFSSGLPDYVLGEGEAQLSSAPMYPYYYHQPPAVAPRFSAQEHRRRKLEATHPSPDRSGGSKKFPPQQYHGVVPAYKSPGVHRRGISPKNSFSSSQSHPSGQHYQQHGWGQSMINSNSSYSSAGPSPGRATPLSGRLRVPTPPGAKELFPMTLTGTSGEHGVHVHMPPSLPAPPEEDELNFQGSSHDQLNALSLGASSNFSSFATMDSEDKESAPQSDNSMKLGQLLVGSTHQRQQQQHSGGHHSRSNRSSRLSFQGSQHHTHSLLLSPGNCEETPLIGNSRRVVDAQALRATPSLGVAPMPALGGEDQPQQPQAGTTEIPYIPALDASSHHVSRAQQIAELPPMLHASLHEAPPRSILMDELRLVQMETGNGNGDSPHWRIQESEHASDDDDSVHSFGGDAPQSFGSANSSGSSISIPSGDPRKNIPHKRPNLTEDTDAAGSLQGRIRFQELQLIEVIGGGGFGQVWRAAWQGTPVAVKVLTGSAQNKHVAKAILEEFKAEINLLKGMRHPNICLYMGACVDPPNRAIITELAANGSVWDALRLPLMPPYMPADGTQRGCWPAHLYSPDETHGAPPTVRQSPMALSAPIPPKGTWPWELVKKVACGAARGMAYLHGGNPPVLHRDLKSANLLLDESYTTKVCDFGLSRLKAKERSMTGNCGTVQWMAPEVLANMSYNEKADVYSFGIVLWELLSRECPYDSMTAIQCALAVLNRDKRPEIPKWCPPSLHALIKSCVKKEPDQRPSFTQIILALDAMG